MNPIKVASQPVGPELPSYPVNGISGATAANELLNHALSTLGVRPSSYPITRTSGATAANEFIHHATSTLGARPLPYPITGTSGAVAGNNLSITHHRHRVRCLYLIQ